jgi:hypothetical protein
MYIELQFPMNYMDGTLFSLILTVFFLGKMEAKVCNLSVNAENLLFPT